MADLLPPEVITDILSRLPVHSLIRFRCTCKSWRSLIDSTHFILLHLRTSLSSHSHSTLVLRRDSELYQVNLGTLDRAIELNHPLMCYSNSIKVLGSCNGLLCLCNVAEDIALWNPNIRKHRLLPYLPAERRERDTTLFAARVYGFGYDSFSEDYKLVRISYFVDLHSRTFYSHVKLYSLRVDSWKSLPNMPYGLCCARTMGVFVGGALHWVVTRKLEPDQPDLIVAFDLRLESFNEVPLPETGNVNGNFEMDVSLLGGCLCMVEHRGSTRIDVWVMEEYGSVDSWCKLFSLTEHHNLRSLKSVKPLAYSGDGDRVLMEHDHKKLCWYSLKDKVVSEAKIPGMPHLIEATVYVGTLVPPTLLIKSDGGAKQKHGDDKGRRRRDDFLSQGFKLTL
ncbi:F-box protein CPR1-like [Arachis stenosperma]|uniref:F-box protein CPR1-like n=1 Tax=Arachis stenosperma TaxID=217475 RepID=UPI0025AC0F5E|nr:F-box protein CPR1-like [Arachis stenosperma]